MALEEIEQLSIDEEPVEHYVKWKAHEREITLLRLFKFPALRLVTAASESHVLKIWTLTGCQVGSLNIMMPLPYLWGLRADNKALRV